LIQINVAVIDRGYTLKMAHTMSIGNLLPVAAIIVMGFIFFASMFAGDCWQPRKAEPIDRRNHRFQSFISA